jgi:hypothetical protein
MYARPTASAICLALPRTSSNVSKLNGAAPSGRWHSAQRCQMMGAMSRENVGPGGAWTAARTGMADMNAAGSTAIDKACTSDAMFPVDLAGQRRIGFGQ